MAKKFLSVFMALVLAVLCVIPAFAESEKVNPILVISGFSQYKFVDTVSGKQVWTPETSIIVDLVTKALPPLTTLLASSKNKADYDKFVDAIVPVANDYLRYISVGPDAEPVDNNVKLIDQFTGPVSNYDYAWVKTVFENDIVDIACDAVGKENVWVYGLDWRVDPLVLADEIHEYVKNIKKTTKCDKISVSGISMGGIVMSCYLAKYGYEDFSNITYLSAAFTGIDYVGEMFSGNIKVDCQGLINIIKESMHDTSVTDILEKTQILDKLLPIVDDLVKYEKDRIYTEILMPNFGYNTGLWAFCPDEYFASAKAFMKARMNEGTAEDAAKFWGKVDDYHNNVQLKINDILHAAQNDGVTVSLVSCYNLQMPPVSPASKYMGDQVIEARHTSGFATVADYGQRLNVEVGPHIAADKMIDANSAYFPENTWFVKNQQHVGFSNAGTRDNGAFYKWILTAPEGTDVYSNPRFPQFMYYFNDIKELRPLGDVDGNMKLSIADAKMILKSVSGSRVLTNSQIEAAELSGDSKVSIVDAKLVLRSIAAS